jgi:hypothetical protein
MLQARGAVATRALQPGRHPFAEFASMAMSSCDIEAAPSGEVSPGLARRRLLFGSASSELSLPGPSRRTQDEANAQHAERMAAVAAAAATEADDFEVCYDSAVAMSLAVSAPCRVQQCVTVMPAASGQSDSCIFK